MTDKDQTTLIFITTAGGMIVSMNHDKEAKEKGGRIKEYLDHFIFEVMYELKFVTSFVDNNGETRIQYTLIKI